MTPVDALVRELAERSITPHDLEDTILALKQDSHSLAMAGAADAEQDGINSVVAAETEALTAAGLMAQVTWMAGYYDDLDNLNWALAGYLNLPLAA